MKRKLRVGVMFGGRSSEHEVSLMSAKNVMAAMDRSRYVIVPFKIPKDGKVAFDGLRKLDVVFPVLHGTYGEDGSVQGLLRMLDVPFVGPDITGSSVGMDKDVAKRLLRDAKIPVADFLTFERGESVRPSAVWKRLGKPVFVKPANQGSSVGVHKARTDAELKTAVKDAFRFDTKILVEEAVPGREIEVSVLGNETPEASVPGEVIPHHEFYSYEAKYLDEDGAGLAIPADIPAAAMRKVRALAVATFRTLGLEGMARVDFFMRRNGGFVVNEVNTIPGFTRISMYPKLWAASGLPYPKLIDRLIALALERHARRSRLSTKRAA
ncbi:MAG: D-alanine--D-alanine ligase family protein [Patescibacteria group bacterium]